MVLKVPKGKVQKERMEIICDVYIIRIILETNIILENCFMQSNFKYIYMFAIISL